MTDMRKNDALARTVFAGLAPTPFEDVDGDRSVRQDSGRLSRGVRTTGTIVLAGAITVAMNLTGPIDAHAAPVKRAKPQSPAEAPADRSIAARAATAVTGTAPATYRVKAGDTVSGIAAKYGLSTASVLTLNGLSWKSLIFPGQVLKLSRPAASRQQVAAAQPVASTSSASAAHTVKAGDTISRIAAKYGVTTQKVLDANGLKWSSIIYPGQRIMIPGRTASAGAQTPIADSASIDVEEVGNVTPAPSHHTVQSGETVSGIATKYGVTTQSMLDANGLKISSVIYPGQKLVIPGRSGGSSSTVALSGEQSGNARIIINVGRSLGVSDRGIVIALAAAMQESSLRNISYGDLDSVGLFQQRPSVGWGSVQNLTNPEHAARLFYGGPSNPNKGNTAGLLDIKGWQSMSVTRAAQAVQISAYPDAYAKWESSARAWLAQLG